MGGKCGAWTTMCCATDKWCPNLGPTLSSAFSSSLLLRHAALGLRFLSVTKKKKNLIKVPKLTINIKMYL